MTAFRDNFALYKIDNGICKDQAVVDVLCSVQSKMFVTGTITQLSAYLKFILQF